MQGSALQARRVDARMVGDSILTEILTAISNSRLHSCRSDGTWTSRRQGDEERKCDVRSWNCPRGATPGGGTTFRSDNEPLLFDVANVRVNTYDPDGNPEEARKQVSETILEALREMDLTRHLAVQAAARDAGPPELGHAFTGGRHERSPAFPNALNERGRGYAANNAAITQLLGLGALATNYARLTPELIQGASDEPAADFPHYNVTPFGKAIIEFVAHEMGALEPDVWTAMKERFVE